MLLGVMSALFSGRPLDQVCESIAEIGLGAIELPVGAWPGKPYFDPRKVLASSKEQARIRDTLKAHGLICSALAVHGNPVHPDKGFAKKHHDDFVAAMELAPKLGTDIVITFSGCPGGSKKDVTPNWVTCPWPNDFSDVLKYQWDDVLVPYWSAQAKAAAKRGLRIAWEPHPGFCVYNSDTAIRLSERAQKAAGLRGKPVLGVNLDPSHLFWQGMDPIVVARALAEAGLIFHVHAKDTELDRVQGPLNGYLDARPYGDIQHRAWNFRTCGWGHGEDFWRPFISQLRRGGYDHVLSIEHEDMMMSIDEGFERAVAFLLDCIIEEQPATPWWT